MPVTGLDVTIDLAYTGTATVVQITLLRVVRLRSLQEAQRADVTITGDDDLIDEAAETVIVDITGVTNVTRMPVHNRPLLLPMMMPHRLYLSQ